MKRTICLACLVVLGMASAAARASDPIGIYALIDRVVLEPSDSEPQRIQIWGAFSVAMRQFGDQYTVPVRGYLYYSLDGQKDAAARAEWADMQKVASTGQIIAFGSRYKQFGVIRRGAGPVAGREVDEKELARLITQLDDQDQNKRDAATDELKRMGIAAERKLRTSLPSVSAEARARIERVLGDLQPDPYPMGFGLARIRADQSSEHVRLLQKFPAAFSPADGALTDAGSIKLVAGNVAASASNPKYFFDIENAAGEKESSPAIEQGQKQTEWSPKMQIKSGEKYTWHVWAEDGKNRGPVADAAIRGK